MSHPSVILTAALHLLLCEISDMLQLCDELTTSYQGRNLVMFHRPMWTVRCLIKRFRIYAVLVSFLFVNSHNHLYLNCEHKPCLLQKMQCLNTTDASSRLSSCLTFDTVLCQCESR